MPTGLTLKDCRDHIRHTLGGELSDELVTERVVNEAGQHLVNMHPWKYLLRRSATIDARAKITLTSATYDPTATVSSVSYTNVITSTGDFASYEWLAGDKLLVTSGTGVDAKREATILQRFSDDQIQIDFALAGAQVTDLDATITLNSLELPDDFRNIIHGHAVSATNSLVDGLYLTSVEDILRKRTNQIDVSSSWNFYGAVTFAGSPPIPILEVYPNPLNKSVSQFTIFYNAGWKMVDTDSVKLDLPDYMEPLFIQILRAVARGYEEEDISPMSDRLDAIMRSMLFRQTQKRDGGIQPTYGPMKGGVVRSMPRGRYRRLLSTTVDAPT